MRRRTVPDFSERQVIGARVERLDDGDIPHRESRLAVAEIVIPFTNEAVIEPERSHLLELRAEVRLPEAKRAHVVVALILHGVDNKASASSEEFVNPVDREQQRTGKNVFLDVIHAAAEFVV